MTGDKIISHNKGEGEKGFLNFFEELLVHNNNKRMLNSKNTYVKKTWIRFNMYQLKPISTLLFLSSFLNVFDHRSSVLSSHQSFENNLIFFVDAETKLFGGPDMIVEAGSTINLTCTVKHVPKPPEKVILLMISYLCF